MRRYSPTLDDASARAWAAYLRQSASRVPTPPTAG